MSTVLISAHPMNSPPREMVTAFGTSISWSLFDEIQGHLRDFFERFIIDEGCNYEVEAKFGTFIDLGTNGRVSLPVLNSCVLAPGYAHRFESNLSINQHRSFNELLNRQVTKNPSTWKYRHERTIDTVYLSPQRKKVRVSRDQQGHLLAIIEKKKVADLSLHLPTSPVDVRISINLEDRLPPMTEETLAEWTVQSVRSKDRVSYEFDRFMNIDLTQVKQQDNSGRGSNMLHELELELVHVHRQLDDPELIPRFLCNIFDFARYTRDP